MYGKVLGGDVSSLLLHHCPQIPDGSHMREERLIWSPSLRGVCCGENAPLGFTGFFVLGAGGGYLLTPPQFPQPPETAPSVPTHGSGRHVTFELQFSQSLCLQRRVKVTKLGREHTY